VWLGNNRGNKYSRRSTVLDPDVEDREFFDYSFFEMGQFDDPAMINYIRSHTGKASISYIGHSQGNT